jgi:hypothetical protein
MAYGPKLLTVDTRELKKLERDLNTLAKKAIPYAIRTTLNELAFDAQVLWKQKLPQKATLRNKFTQSSIRVEKASGLNLHQMRSVVGSIAPHVEKLEDGEIQHAKGKHGVPVAMPQARTGSSWNKLVRKPNMMGAIALKHAKGRSRRQRNAIALAVARKTNGFAFLNLGKAKGIFKVGKGAKSKAKMIWSLSKKTITSKAVPVMPLAVAEANRSVGSHYRENLIMQLRRHKIFGY